jgi:flagellar assembly factor FliW
MNCIARTETGNLLERNHCVIRMPLGLLGFEQYKSFTLFTRPTEEPFLWLQTAASPKLAFLVVSPFIAVPDYGPTIPEEDVQFLALQSPDDALIVNIVTVRGPKQATVNLKGPIVLNRHTLTAKQVIPLNSPDFSVAHPLPIRGC